MSFVSQALVQNAEQNLAIKERNRITMYAGVESAPVYKVRGLADILAYLSCIVRGAAVALMGLASSVHLKVLVRRST